MRTTLFTLLGGALIAAPAAAQDDPKAIIQKAIDAQGGAEKLGRFKGGRAAVKGTVSVQGQQVPVTGEILFQYPLQARARFELTFNGMKIPVIQLVNGETVDISVAGMKQPIGPAETADLKESAYSSWLQQLTPVLADPMFQLKPLAESQFQGKALVGVQIGHPKHKDVKMYFDKATGLLTKLERPSVEMGREVSEETVYSEYKEFEGLKVPTREVATKDGKPQSDLMTTEYKPLEKVDPKEFEAGN
jgi:hypothetical protein